MIYFFIKFSGLMMFCCITFYFAGLQKGVTESPVIVIDKLTAVRDVNNKFLSVALDTDLIRTGKIYCIKWVKIAFVFNFSSSKKVVVTLSKCFFSSSKFLHRASLLAPAFLRIGGTSADRLIFDEDGSHQNKQLSTSNMLISEQELYDECNKNTNNFTMTGKLWSSINNFSKTAGFQLVFDLNVLLRNCEKWDTSNAFNLLLFSSHINPDIVWQLGNEPNSFQHTFGTPISPSQLGNDFQELRTLLNQFLQYKKSMVIGPDITRPRHLEEDPIHYLQDFLISVGNSTINAVTWHQYYLNGRIATLQDFINPSTLNKLREQIATVKEVVDKHLPGVPIWLSETGSAYGGGAPNLSNTYVAGFLWLDKLGLAARYGIDVVIRQSLYYGYYTLLDVQTLDPLPDWWLSIIYKKLVGTTVLDMEQFISNNGPLRIYAHCSSAEERLSKGSVITLFGMNLSNITSSFNIQTTSLKTEPEISVYLLTGCNTLTSRYICLNGKPLILKSDESLPEFKPLIQDLHTPIYLPPHSLGFWTVHGIHVEACAADVLKK